MLDRWKSVLWSDESKSEIFGSNRRVLVRHRVGERMISERMIFASDTVSDLFRIEGTLNQHGYHSILQRYAIPSGLHLVGLSFVLQGLFCKGY